VSTVKTKEAAGGTFFGDLFQAGIYKRSQGRISRQITFAALALAAGVACWRLAATLERFGWVASWARGVSMRTDVLASSVALIVFAALAWICYRVVNIHRFADFLIAVEAEMNKVSWPSKPELVRSSMVVLFTIFMLAAVLFVFDSVWVAIFDLIGIQGGARGAG